MNSIKHKIIGLVSVVAMTSTILVLALFAVVYDHLKIDDLFGKHIEINQNQAVQIVDSYLQEHVDNVKFKALYLQNQLERSLLHKNHSDEDINNFLNKYSNEHSISEIVVFEDNGKIIYKSALSFSLLFHDLPAEAINSANAGYVYLRLIGESRVQGVIRLNVYSKISHKPLYALIGKEIKKEIISTIKDSSRYAEHYSFTKYKIDKLKQPIFWIFCTAFIVVFIAFVMIANRLAGKIISPLQDLSLQISRIQRGKYDSLKIKTRSQDKEILFLINTLRRMSHAIKTRERKIQNAKNILSEKMLFISTVLRQISSGVIVLNSKGEVVLCNKEGGKVISKKKSISTVSKSLHNAFLDTQKNTEQIPKSYKISINSKDLLIQGTKLKTNNEEQVVLTVNDMTDIYTAEKIKNWKQIAQKVAHEIKNPLTPIQLCIEMLKERFVPQDTKSQKSFLKYANTIIQRVDDIKSLLNNFLYFGNIAKPIIKDIDIIRVINEILVLEKSSHPNIKYSFDKRHSSCYCACDRMQISQVLINLLKNAAEAINSTLSHGRNTSDSQQSITISLSDKGKCIAVNIEDTGHGIAHNADIGKQYVTTKADGLGLGLSMVKNIMKEHPCGAFSLRSTKNGAIASFQLKKSQGHQNTRLSKIKGDK